MDADDVCLPHRLQTQVAFLEAHPEIDLLGAAYRQMDERMERAVGDRHLPELHADIVTYGKFRTPVNHVTIMFRREAALLVGGYEVIEGGLLEDWWLALKLANANYRLHNLREPLVLVRGGADFARRRSGARYAHMEFVNFLAMHRARLISTPVMLRNIAVRCTSRLLPPRLIQVAYDLFLRSKSAVA
jgi:hypothetical protein